MKRTITIEAIKKELDNRSDRSAWAKGVTLYARDLVESLEEAINYGNFSLNDWMTPRALRAALLNGAKDWEQYSWGGCSLIYDRDIAERLCTPSELKRTRNGERRPNAREEWLDTQASALFQAANLIFSVGRKLLES